MSALLTGGLSDTPASAFEERIRPLLAEFCLGCHSTAEHKGDLDLERFSSDGSVKEDSAVWEAVLAQLEDGEMPPEDEPQLPPGERAGLIAWAEATLREIALDNAGDPGPVVLRRLSNREFTYTVRDLTGVGSLDPAREFPADGAAGEGFTNVGDALAMSPALLTKYLDAAKEIAAHAVLLPGSIRFSESTTARDWTEETLGEIRALYSKYTDPGGAAAMDLQGVRFDTNGGGRLPLDRYLAALDATRDPSSNGGAPIAALARDHGLSPKYLGLLSAALAGSSPSPVLADLRDRWRDGNLEPSAIAAWQGALWRFASVGHIGKANGPARWQEPVDPLVARQELRLDIAAADIGREAGSPRDRSVFLVASDAGDGNEGDRVVWENPRLEIEGHSPIPLGSVEPVARQLRDLLQSETVRTADYLAELAAEAGAGTGATDGASPRIAGSDLHPTLLDRWRALVRIDRRGTPAVAGHFENRLHDVGGWAEVRGWGFHETPSLIANESDETIRFSTLAVPGRSVNLHPSPEREAVVHWRSPDRGQFRVSGLVADSDSQCGNGVTWTLAFVDGEGSHVLADGTIDNGGRAEIRVEGPVAAQPGDLVRIAVGPRDGSHVCDTTQVSLTITEIDGGSRVWDLADGIVDRIHEGNPLSDRFGNRAVWHFGESPGEDTAAPAIAPGSALDQWRESVAGGGSSEATAELAASVAAIAAAESPPAGLGDPDQALHKLLRDPHGPLNWLQLAIERLPPEPRDIAADAPAVLEFAIPAEIAPGLPVTVAAALRLDPSSGENGSVQAAITSKAPDPALLRVLTAPVADSAQAKETWTGHGLTTAFSSPVIALEDSAAWRRFHSGFDDFRNLFPAALCYAQIVPVDEVVTLTLFHREDDHLVRLMLDDGEAGRLDRLWDELQFVSRAPLAQVDAFEQLYQFATQDADPSVFEPLREPIARDAAAFRNSLRAAAPRHLEAAIGFAGRAWRRPLTAAEREGLEALYQTLRTEELDHDPAIRQLIARILVAPAFLYRGEAAAAGDSPAPVNDWELATRLSYFLWSSTPDEELRAAAATGALAGPESLAAQVRRMLRDDRVRRLATEFGAQWLHTRDLAALDEKSERHFPGFAALRGSMQEETVRFMADLFQNDRSVLSLLDADHTFVDAKLAAHYGIALEPEPAPGEWRRAEGLRDLGRGGVLGFAAVLAKQSGASRTSPILRGNWVSEVILGERLPRPPKDVPVLPEEPPDGLTERQLIERHSSDPSCARCHDRIDPLGFALEGFDAIGGSRSGADTMTTLPDGTAIDGTDGLRAWLSGPRRDDFVRQFCRKLLGYALGRSVQLSDQPLIDEMMAGLATNQYSVGTAVELVVDSPQFRRVRGRAHPSPTR